MICHMSIAETRPQAGRSIPQVSWSAITTVIEGRIYGLVSITFPLWFITRTPLKTPDIFFATTACHTTSQTTTPMLAQGRLLRVVRAPRRRTICWQFSGRWPTPQANQKTKMQLHPPVCSPLTGTVICHDVTVEKALVSDDWYIPLG